MCIFSCRRSNQMHIFVGKHNLTTLPSAKRGSLPPKPPILPQMRFIQGNMLSGMPHTVLAIHSPNPETTAAISRRKNRKAAPSGAAFPLSFRSMCAVTARRSTAETGGITWITFFRGWGRGGRGSFYKKTPLPPQKISTRQKARPCRTRHAAPGADGR